MYKTAGKSRLPNKALIIIGCHESFSAGFPKCNRAILGNSHKDTIRFSVAEALMVVECHFHYYHANLRRQLSAISDRCLEPVVDVRHKSLIFTVFKCVLSQTQKVPNLIFPPVSLVRILKIRVSLCISVTSGCGLSPAVAVVD